MRLAFVVQKDYFLPGHCTLQEFRENIPTCNKICTPSGVTGFSSSEAALLSLDKASSYCFQRVSGRNAYLQKDGSYPSSIGQVDRDL